MNTFVRFQYGEGYKNNPLHQVVNKPGKWPEVLEVPGTQGLVILLLSGHRDDNHWISLGMKHIVQQKPPHPPVIVPEGMDDFKLRLENGGRRHRLYPFPGEASQPELL